MSPTQSATGVSATAGRVAKSGAGVRVDVTLDDIITCDRNSECENPITRAVGRALQTTIVGMSPFSPCVMVAEPSGATGVYDLPDDARAWLKRFREGYEVGAESFYLPRFGGSDQPRRSTSELLGIETPSERLKRQTSNLLQKILGSVIGWVSLFSLVYLVFHPGLANWGIGTVAAILLYFGLFKHGSLRMELAICGLGILSILMAKNILGV
jgi:hypothetical protein